jgi:hypothetical protein
MLSVAQPKLSWTTGFVKDKLERVYNEAVMTKFEVEW